MAVADFPTGSEETLGGADIALLTKGIHLRLSACPQIRYTVLVPVSIVGRYCLERMVWEALVVQNGQKRRDGSHKWQQIYYKRHGWPPLITVHTPNQRQTEKQGLLVSTACHSPSLLPSASLHTQKHRSSLQHFASPKTTKKFLHRRELDRNTQDPHHHISSCPA